MTKSKVISGALVPVPETAAPMEPMLLSNLIVSLSRTAPVQAGAPEPEQSWNQVVIGSFQLTAGLGEHLLLYFPLTAVSADGLFLRTCQHVPTCSCQLI